MLLDTFYITIEHILVLTPSSSYEVLHFHFSFGLFFGIFSINAQERHPWRKVTGFQLMATGCSFCSAALICDFDRCLPPRKCSF